MALEKDYSPRTLGATTPAGRAREADFKSQLKNFFPDIRRIDFSYSDIKYSHEQSEKLKSEGCFGYHHKETIIIDGKPAGISWLPHIKDMPPTYIKWLVERIAKGDEKEEEEEETNDVDISCDTSFVSVVDS